jgi:hypothetical protein
MRLSEVLLFWEKDKANPYNMKGSRRPILVIREKLLIKPESAVGQKVKKTGTRLRDNRP